MAMPKCPVETGASSLHASEMMGTSDGWDGVHFTPEDHAQLGQGLAEEVQAMAGR